VLSLLLYGLVAVVAVAVLYGLAVLVLPAGEQLAPPAPDLKPWSLTDRSLNAEDLVTVRLPVALRGYRFAETDQLLDRLTYELAQRDEEISRLRGATFTSGPAQTATPWLASAQPVDGFEAPQDHDRSSQPPAFDPSAPHEA